MSGAAVGVQAPQEEEGEELSSPGVILHAERQETGKALPLLEGENGAKRPSPLRRTTTATGKGWNTLKSKLQVFTLRSAATAAQEEKAASLNGSQLITELTLGTLANLTLRLGMDIDEYGHKRIPVLMNFMSAFTQPSELGGTHAFNGTHRIEHYRFHLSTS